jgi:hypothetical protein
MISYKYLFSLKHTHILISFNTISFNYYDQLVRYY